MKDSNKDKVVRKTIPELYHEKKECCGCSACFAVCPAGAIVMMPDEEGFLYPVIEKEKCLKCGKCLNVCPFR